MHGPDELMLFIAIPPAYHGMRGNNRPAIPYFENTKLFSIFLQYLEVQALQNSSSSNNGFCEPEPV